MQQDQDHSAARLTRIEAYLASDPANATLLADAVDTAMAAGQLDRAAMHARAAMAAHPSDPYAASRLGNVLLAQQAWHEAAILFSGLLASHPHPDLAYNLAVARARLGQHQGVCEALLPYAADPALNGAAVVELMRSLHHLTEVGAALDVVATHKERLKDDPVFLGAASLLYFDQGDLEQAQAMSAAALAAGAHPLDAVVVGASLALAEGDAERATVMFDEALRLNPLDGRSWSGQGMTSLLKRDLPQASVQLTRALECMPGHIGTWHSLAWCRIFSQDIAGAEAAFASAMALDRNFADNHGGMAVVAAMQGERDKAQAAIDRALGLDRQCLSARYAQMILSGDTVDPVRFRELAMRLLASQPSIGGRSMRDLVEAYGRR